MSAFRPLSSDSVEFYPLTYNQLRALEILQGVRMSWADYAAMEMPVVVGRLTPKGMQAFAPQPEKSSWFSSKTINFPVYNEFTPQEITDTLFRESEDRPIYQRGANLEEINAQKIAQTGIVQSILQYDQKFFGSAHSREVYFNLYGDTAAPEKVFARDWHIHSNKNERLQELVPKKAVAVPKRIYLWRSNTPTEAIRNEWQRNADGVVLHPLIKPLLEAQQQAGRFRGKSREAADKVEQISETLRREGMIVQATPYEIVLISGYTLHRSGIPKTPIMSTLGRLQIEVPTA